MLQKLHSYLHGHQNVTKRKIMVDFPKILYILAAMRENKSVARTMSFLIKCGKILIKFLIPLQN